jgi:hypothetical protein
VGFRSHGDTDRVLIRPDRSGFNLGKHAHRGFRIAHQRTTPYLDDFESIVYS